MCKLGPPDLLSAFEGHRSLWLGTVQIQSSYPVKLTIQLEGAPEIFSTFRI